MKLADLPGIPRLVATWQSAQGWYDGRFHTAERLHAAAQKFLPEEFFAISDIDKIDKDSQSFTIRISGIPSGNVPRSVEIMSVVSNAPIKFKISGPDATSDLATGSQVVQYLKQWKGRALGVPETSHALVPIRH